MKSKIILFTLAMTMGSALFAHADELEAIKRELAEKRRQQQEQQQPPLTNPDRGYDQAPDEGLDPEYRRPNRDAARIGEGGYRREEGYREEGYREERFEEGYAEQYGRGGCGPRCGAGGPPVALPLPIHRPHGPCQIVSSRYGWTIVVNGSQVIQEGRHHQYQRIPMLRQNFLAAGICTVFLN